MPRPWVLLSLWMLALGVVGSWMTTVPAQAAGGSLRVGAAQPASFVPAWDGQSDSTAVAVRVGRRSVLTVRVRRSGGAVVRVLARGDVVQRGRKRFFWDGRDAAGRPVAAGDYRIEVVSARSRRAAPVPQRARVSSPARGAVATAATRTRRSVAVRVALPDISMYDLRVSRGFLGSRSGTAATRVRYRLTRQGQLSAAVADASGRVVRNLHRGPHHGGRGSVTWNGRADSGARVPDGLYTMQFAASTGAAPTNTMRVPLRVDTQAPVTGLAGRRLGAQLRGRGVLVALPLRLSESARVSVRGRGSRWAIRRRPVAANTRFLTLTGRQLGIKARRARASYRVVVAVTDAAGNTRREAATVVVRAWRPQRHAPVATPAPPVAPAVPATPTSGTMVWPARGTFSSEFGPRWGRMHQGIDISAPTGTPIVAALAGTVSFAGSQGGYGNLVQVEHAGGLRTLYAHQSRIFVVTGQYVSAGALIGHVGSTGHSTGPHLHFETRLAGIPVDPRRFLPAGAPPTL